MSTRTQQRPWVKQGVREGQAALVSHKTHAMLLFIFNRCWTSICTNKHKKRKIKVIPKTTISSFRLRTVSRY